MRLRPVTPRLRLVARAAALVALAALGPDCRCRRAPLPEKPVAAVWAVGDGDDLERDDGDEPRTSALWDGKTVRLFGARNEIVAFQIMVRAGRPGISELGAALPALSAGDGSSRIVYQPPAADPTDTRGRPIQLFAVNYMNVPRPTRADFIYTPKGKDAPADPTGEKPVQLVPENARAGRGGFPLSVRPGENQALWFEIDTGRDRPAGIYRGEVSISADGEKVAVPVEALFDFALPEQNSLTAMVYFESSQVELYQGPGLDPAYHRFAHRHRIELVDSYTEDGVRAARGRWSGSDFSLAAGYEGPGQDVGNRVVPVSFYSPGEGWEEREPAWRKADAWMELLKIEAPGALTFIYMADEPPDEVFPEIRALGERLGGNPGPGRQLLRFVTREFVPGLAAAVDIWCATAKRFDLATAARERAAGRQTWFYNGGRPYAPALVIDAPASDARVIGWQAFKAEVPVYFYWHAVHWQHNSQKLGTDRNQNVWANPVTFDLRSGNGKGEFANGDGVLIYPGTEKLHPDQDRGIAGPIASVQLANLRRGLQDHLYLTLAKKRGHGALVDELVNAIVPRVFSGTKGKVSFPEETAPFELARRRLAEALGKPAAAGGR